MPWLHRWLGNPVLSGLGRTVFSNVRSLIFTVGFEHFDETFVSNLIFKRQEWNLPLKMVIKPTLLGGKIAEIPITLYKDGRNRRPHLNTWRDGW